MITLMILLLIGCTSMSLGTDSPKWKHLKINGEKWFACVAYQKENNANSFTVEDAKAHCRSLNKKKCKNMELLDDMESAIKFVNSFMSASQKHEVLQYTKSFLTGATSTKTNCTNCVLKKKNGKIRTKSPAQSLNGHVGIICAKSVV